MSKAILVVDIPNGYELDQLAVNYMLYSVDGKVLDGDMGKELKPMPQKKDYSGFYSQGFSEYEERYYDGYNDCINEILGDNDE